ncbi:MAG: S-adenosylhomocysteine hydrolase [Pseudomonadota bacterium]
MTTTYKRDTESLLERIVDHLGFNPDERHRWIIVAHLFDDTRRMLDALERVIEFDAVFGVPYSSNRPGVREAWTERYGDLVHIPADLPAMEAELVAQLGRSLAACRAQGQKLIVQEVGGFVVPLLHKYFRDDLHLVAGVVEITKQGVWRAQELDLRIPVLHCADSELKRLEAQRCGETIVRCVDGIARELGISLAGRVATVVGAGWIGTGVARALRRIDALPAVVDLDPLKLAEARLDGFSASRHGDKLEESALVIGATGARSLPAEMLERLPHGAIVASASSRQHEIDVEFLKSHPSDRVGKAVEAFHLYGDDVRPPRSLLLVNDGFPANFIPGSGSVPDEIVETILAELIVLMHGLTERPYAPGIHRISRDEERVCAELWLQLRDGSEASQSAPSDMTETRATPRLETL